MNRVFSKIIMVCFAGAIVTSIFAQGSVTLRLAEVHPQDYPTAVADKEFAKMVEERTKGRVKIECSFGGALGQEKAVVADIQAGKIDFARISLSPVAEMHNDLNVLVLPYLYTSADQMWKVLNGPIGENLLTGLETSKIVGLCYFDAGARNFYAKKEIKRAADLKGLKIRVQENKLMMGIVTSLGATPLPMAVGDIYAALQSGKIDAAENNIPSYISFSHYEVATNYIFDGHTMVPEILIASIASMEKLSKEDQEIVKKAAKDVVPFQIKKWAEREKEAEQKAIDAGCTIVKPDAATMAEFQKAVAPMYDEFGKDFKDIIAKIKATK